MNDQPSDNSAVEGVITARSCACCGHHEIGIVTASGEFIPLRPGMRVSIYRHAENGAVDSTA